MAITSEPGGTYSVIFNAQYAIDPAIERHKQQLICVPPTPILKAVESTETIAGAIPTRTFTPVSTVAAAGTVAASYIT
jgi:hypothetical protein